MQAPLLGSGRPRGVGRHGTRPRGGRQRAHLCPSSRGSAATSSQLTPYASGFCARGGSKGEEQRRTRGSERYPAAVRPGHAQADWKAHAIALAAAKRHAPESCGCRDRCIPATGLPHAHWSPAGPHRAAHAQAEAVTRRAAAGVRPARQPSTAQRAPAPCSTHSAAHRAQHDLGVQVVNQICGELALDGYLCPQGAARASASVRGYWRPARPDRAFRAGQRRAIDQSHLVRQHAQVMGQLVMGGEDDACTADMCVAWG